VFECHVEPVAVVLCTDPAWTPETENEADLGEDDLVGCELRPVSCLCSGMSRMCGDERGTQI